MLGVGVDKRFNNTWLPDADHPVTVIVPLFNVSALFKATAKMLYQYPAYLQDFLGP